MIIYNISVRPAGYSNGSKKIMLI